MNTQHRTQNDDPGKTFYAQSLHYHIVFQNKL